MMKGMLITIIILHGFLVSVQAEMRIWTSVKGDTIEAEFIKIFSGTVVLRRADTGKEIKVPQSGLCSADIKYIKSSIPPKIEIEVDVNNDKKETGSYSSDYSAYGYSKKRQKVKCEVTITKKSKDPSTMPLSAKIYVISKDMRLEEMEVSSFDQHEFSFEKQKEVVFHSEPLVFDYSKSSYDGNRGDSYEGYLVCILNENEQIIAAKGSRNFFEDNAAKFLSARKGTKFDKDLYMRNVSKKKGRNQRND
jgi:hypothetical protein